MPKLPSGHVLLLSRIILLAFAYFAAGRLALLLAIPPGFATAIFPPLGISLAAVLLWGNELLWGVFIGSFILNSNISLLGGAPFSVGTFLIAAEIAVGSCLAAFAGATLIRRHLGFPNDLTDEWSVFLFFSLGGPIASSISASVGTGALCLNNVIPLSTLGYSWLTWWTGDTIGVLIATPFVFIFFAKPRSLWRNRFTGVGIPLLVSCVLIVVIFFNTAHSEQQKIQRVFQSTAQAMSQRLFSVFDSHINILTPLKGLYIASDEVTAEEFRLFTRALLAGPDSVTALSWNQLVRLEQRESYEHQVQAEGFSNFHIRELDVNTQQLVTAPSRNNYVAITYIEPYAKYGRVQGFNVASEAVRKHALDFANDTGSPAMTAPVRLLQDEVKGLSYLIFMPVYKSADVPRTPNMRAELLRGYVTAFISVTQQIERLKKEFPSEDFSFFFKDLTDPENPVELYADHTSVQSPYARMFTWEANKSVGGRELQIRIMPTAGFIDRNRDLQSWYVLVGGLLFCSLLGGFLLLVTGRTQHIASLVEQRTLELNAILSEAVEAIVIIDSSGHIERANPAACQLLLMDHAKLQNLKADTILPVLAELAAPNQPELVEATLWKSRETIAIRSDAVNIPVEIGVSSVNLPNRRIYTCLIHDITARKKVDRLKSEFISTVSHELRTPLTSITGVLGLLIGGAVPEIPVKALDLLVIAKNNAERLGRLVNDILDIEKLEFGKLELNMVECDVNKLIQQAIEQNSGYAIKYGVHLALDNTGISNQHLAIYADVHRFLQVMANLISNAVKFSNLGGIVTISAKVVGDTITFYVEDHGAGIPEAFRNKIFQKFAQADSSDTRQRDGTGLGLSISRVIVERMGGEINYQTEVNKGTIFYFSMPLVRARDKHS